MKTKLKSILKKYLKGKSSEDEEKLIVNFYNYLDSGANDKISEDNLKIIEDRIFDKLQQHQVRTNKRKLYINRVSWAASILLPLLFIGGYYLWTVQGKETTVDHIYPGIYSANLILENGTNYSLTTQQDIQVLIDKGVYAFGSNEEQQVIHQIVTPRGAYYQLLLPDSSLVWLNSETSIRFPNKFDSHKREVYLVGEAFFEVKHNTKTPFIVHTEYQTTKVLGTKFNVNSYRGQDFDVVTLIEGSVETSSKYNEKLLMKPGHQAKVGRRIHNSIVENAADFAAWRSGDFYFNDTPLIEVMKMIGRWYNVDINTDYIPENRLNGLINRNVPLEQLLGFIEMTSKIKILYQDSKLKVLPNKL